MVPSITSFVLKNFNGATLPEVDRCLSKASIIIFDGVHILVADHKYVYYFGSVGTGMDTYRFYLKHKHYISGKYSYTTNKKILRIMASRVVGTAPDGTIKYKLK